MENPERKKINQNHKNIIFLVFALSKENMNKKTTNLWRNIFLKE